LRPQDRLIVALDVPTSEEALRLVDELNDLVSFYKVGLELLMAGGMGELLRAIAPRHKVFVDLKLPHSATEIRCQPGTVERLHYQPQHAVEEQHLFCSRFSRRQEFQAW